MTDVNHVGRLVTWRKSSRCGESGTCVEMASHDQGVLVRDAKDPDGAILFVDRAAWRSFVAGIRTGEFDAL
ncbi:MAG: hypothetical protein AUI10_12770 [Actinobacteria bacterium 13_2_20CM_2_72_6]|nr:MAG: hypothetical protein AUI10_12770 [Actinobacteria bacterium 13_2_20CM_2_72_6]